MAHLHGKIIDFSELDIIPTRDNYLNKKDIDHTDAIIYPNESKEGYDINSPIKDLLFLPNDFKIIHERINNKLAINFLVFGIFPDGRKTALILEGVDIYFDVKKPIDMENFEFTRIINNISRENRWNIIYKKINYRNGKGYSDKKYDYYRLLFKTSWSRKKALTYVINILKWETFTDDNSHLERVISRDYKFNWCNWNVITKFKSYKKESICKLPKTFRVDIRDLREIDYDISDISILFRDKCITEAWDIEAFTDTGDLPDPQIETDVVFCIGKTYQFKDSDKPLLQVCIITTDAEPHEDYLTVKCHNQAELLKADAIITSKFKPEIKYGFNDSGFDWNFIITKAKRFNILPEIFECLDLSKEPRYTKASHQEKTDLILKWNCRSMSVKLQADLTRYATTMQTAGCINLDVRIALQKMISNASDVKSSLKHYLTKYGLSNKDDMPIHKLFKIYRDYMDIEILQKLENNVDKKTLAQKKNINLKEMTEIAHYCVIDARRCHDLVLKVNIINDQREISSIARVTLFDAFWYANGMKVQNLLIYKGAKMGLIFPLRYPNNRPCKFEGAHVFYPFKGLVKPKLTVDELKIANPRWRDIPSADLVLMKNAISESHAKKTQVSDSIPFEHKKSRELFLEHLKEHNQYPVIGLDFASLYPSIIMTYNLSPEYIITDEKVAANLKQKGEDIHDIEFDVLVDGETEKKRFWCLRHNSLDGKNLLPGRDKNRFGLYPTILKELFDNRSSMKKILHKHASRKEQLKKILLTNNDDKLKEEQRQINLKYNYINAKQKALKVFMNTFYGVTGMDSSVFFMLAIAADITSMGRKSILLVNSWVTDPKFCMDGEIDYTGGVTYDPNWFYSCKRYYGDTDSIYISVPPAHFVELDAKYYSGQINKEDYCTQLVKKTFKVSEHIRNKVNEYLIRDNNTKFLKMAYEEVLYPSMFMLKKKYAGVEHEKIVNFYPKAKELFIRGLSTKRRDSSKVLKEVTLEVLLSCFNINNILTPEQIIINKIKEIYKRKWNMDDFKKSAVYKPNKQNISVKIFKARMEEREDVNCPPPVPSERFNFVIVKKYPFIHDRKGNKTNIKIGDKMEYFEYAKQNNLEIDLDHYMTGGIIGQFAQILTYKEEFYTNPTDSSDSALDIAEKKTLQKAKKYIENFCKTLTTNYKCKGHILKPLYKMANESIKKRFTDAYDGRIKNKTLTKIVSYYEGDLFVYLKAIINKECKRIADKYAKSFVNRMIKKHNIYAILRTYKKNEKERNKKIELKNNMLMSQFINNRDKYIKLFKNRDVVVDKIISLISNNIDFNRDTKDKLNSNENLSILKNETLYLETLRENEEAIISLSNIFEQLMYNTLYLERANSIINLAKFKISSIHEENPIPPSLNDEEEKKYVMEYYRNNPIDF